MTPIRSGPADAACVPGRQTAVTRRQRTLTASVAIVQDVPAAGTRPAGKGVLATVRTAGAEADASRYAHTDPVADVLERTA
ncbi:hypothetical protein ACWDBD_41145 [Streptomyces sp. NPDC001118]